MSFQPEKIRREHVLQALKEIDGGEKGVRQSTKFDILYEGKTYPPKDVMRLAHEYATGGYEWLPSGGEPTNKYLKALGFKIVNKNKDETARFLNVKKAFAKWLLSNAPDSYNQYLGDTMQSVIERLDEISTFYPNYNFFEVDLKNLNQKIQKIRFMFSVKERQKYPKFLEYDKFHSNGIPKAILGKNNYLKFLKERFSKNNLMNYWIFQGNPNIYDITNALKAAHLKSWKVAAHKDKIKPGDKVIIWQTGEQAGCYALAEVTSGVGIFNEETYETQHYIQPHQSEPAERVKLKITTYLEEAPILWSKIKDLPVFQNFKAGNQGTNFRATKNEYETLLEMTNKTNYTWVKTHKQLAQYLLVKENDQKELIELLKRAGVTGFNDKDKDGNTIELKEIDPFTFFCYIYKYGPKKRLGILQNIASELNLHYPEDELGIPSSNAQKVWLFPYQAQRTHNEVSRLWQFFKATMANNLTDELFVDVLTINSTGKTVLSEGLFNINPEKYFPLNKPTRPFIKEKFGIDANFNSYTEYLKVLEKVSFNTDTPFYQLSYEAWLWKNNHQTSAINKKEIMKSNNLNTILFGPPGTGKTYNTINEALKIVDPKFYNDHSDNREELNKRFKELLIKKWDETKGQIAFCTFHQSFSYEDFVEGIKPKVNDKKEVYYKIENGVFKNICELADSNLSTLKVKKEGKLSWDENKFSRARFYKLSLGNSQISEDAEIYEYCRDNNYIAVGFGDDMDFTNLSETEIKEKFEEAKHKESSAQMLNYFIHYLKKNNYVLISNGNQYVRALGKVVGDYEYNPNAPIRYNHFREVEWVFVDENIPIEEIYEVGLSQRTIYKIDEDKLKPEFFVNKGQLYEVNETVEKDYVLIIDEINRGNVSSIFGELITLIETDKRAGKEEELEVILPYSKQPFKVPHNVHIIGTMNTADKSIEALDTALRRRFSFTEMPPKPKLIETESLSGKVNGVVDDINLKTLLKTINKRIEKLIDKDHKIGHSYFLKVNDKPSLVHCFKNEVIPLLEEYFFGDYGKIGLVLGNSFITKDDADDFEFAAFDGYDTDVSSDLKERSVYKIAKSKDWDFNTI